MALPNPYELPGDPSQWASAAENRLLSIMAVLRYRQPLGPDDINFVGTFFVYPNLLCWIRKLRSGVPARSYAEECPVHGGPRDSRLVDLVAPDDTAGPELHDFCRLREARQPWELQVVLIWNNHLRLRNYASMPESQRREYPSHECVRKVYSRILDNTTIRARWTAVANRGRSAAVWTRWNQVIDNLEKVLHWSPDLNWERLRERMVEQQVPVLVVELCRQSHENLVQWTEGQRTLPNPYREELDRALVALLRPLLLCYRRNWPFPLRRYRSQADDLRKILTTAGVPGLNQIDVFLTEPVLNPTNQRVLLSYLGNVVLPFRRQGLPDGDPLDDAVVQDLFWERVGSPSFDLNRWCREQWPPVGGLAAD